MFVNIPTESLFIGIFTKSINLEKRNNYIGDFFARGKNKTLR